MKMYIPEIGDQIVLVHDWNVSLQREHRNMKLFSKITGNSMTQIVTSSIQQVTFNLASGTILAIDRIYIRKGAGKFSSVTFIIKNDAFKGSRFWAKLSDVNKIEFDIVETHPNVQKPKKCLWWNHHYGTGTRNATELSYDSQDKRFSVYGTYTHDGKWIGWELTDNGKVVKKYKTHHGAMESAERIVKKERNNVIYPETQS